MIEKIALVELQRFLSKELRMSLTRANRSYNICHELKH